MPVDSRSSVLTSIEKITLITIIREVMAIDVMNPFHFVNAAHTSLPTFLILSEIV